MRSTARLIASYTCWPRERLWMDSAEGSNATVTVQNNGVARPDALVPSEDHAGATDTPRVSGQRREHSILGIGASLHVTGFVFADNLNTHNFNGTKGILQRCSLRCSPA